MTKQELASYICNILSIMESKEDAGLHRGKTLGREYERAYKEYIEIIRKEEENVERKEA